MKASLTPGGQGGRKSVLVGADLGEDTEAGSSQSGFMAFEQLEDDPGFSLRRLSLASLSQS